jgi:Chaperone of endosialidase
MGESALGNNTTGGSNTALGFNAGANVITANNVICIGRDVAGNNVDNSCYIDQIFGATSSNGIGVFVNPNGRLGTMTSSRRFKERIKPMGDANEALFSLEPVSFRYKKEVDPESPEGRSQFGLVAEDVEKVNPDLIVRDKEGKPYSVRYDAVNAMLLNEFLKEHKAFVEGQRKVEQQESRIQEQAAMIGRQQKQIEALTAGLQKVSAQLEVSKSAPQVVSSP